MNDFVKSESVTIDMTDVAWSHIVPVTLLDPVEKVVLDMERKRAIIAFRGRLMTSDSETQNSSVSYVEYWKPWWLPKLLWGLLPSRDRKVTLQTTYKSTHPLAYLPELRDRLGPVVVKVQKSVHEE